MCLKRTHEPIHREQHQNHHHDCNDTSDRERHYFGDVARLNGHELAAIDEWLPGTETTPHEIDLTGGCEYRTRYWRCRSCGQERNRVSRHYCQRTNYHVQTLKVTKLGDTATQAVLDLYCWSTLEGSNADFCEQSTRRNAGDLRSLAADKGYDKQALRERLRELDIHPLIKHRIFAPYDHAHNARIDDNYLGVMTFVWNCN